ncbi:P-loop containing nucleoside triphosphate hydrolase protein [Apiospora saccharicola]
MPGGISTSKARWLLFSDIHFKSHDLDRIIKTSQWIVSLPQRYNIQRAIICGDLLTSRTMQQTHVLSACYRFLDQLSSQVPHLNVILGNHDLAYKREYRTSALDALDMHRLSSYVTLHSTVSHQVWEGRRVLVLPFREDQHELTAAVADLSSQDAAETVAFAHLAIHKAVLQRYAVNQVTGEMTPCMPYKGLTGPGGFRTLARTFTGHFHSRQTILQSPSDQLPANDETRLQGSITYLGAPLQMTWGDLYDDQRGVTLLDPETLDQELIVNPHAVGFVTADLYHVLLDCVEASTVSDKHVILLGERTQIQHVRARDKMLSLGARSVRNWIPLRVEQQSGEMVVHGLGATALPGEAQDEIPSIKEEPKPLETLNDEFQPLDFSQLLESYFTNLQLSQPLEERRMELVHVGRAIIRKTSHPEIGRELSYTEFLNLSKSARDSNISLHQSEPETSRIFVAKLHSLSLTNFLGVRETLAINFHDLPQSLTFITGANGSGKSTILEAITWCQFGRCVRAGLGVNDVVNDTAGRGCEVTLTFGNGFSITRYRKHKEHGNRVVVSLHGVPQPQYEKGDARSTQGSIEGLLGTDYETYVRTVLLGSESAVGFLSSTAIQRRDLIETMLGLGDLEAQRDLTKQMIREIDSEQTELQTKQNGLKQVMSHIEGKIETLTEKHRKALLQADKISRTIEQAQKAQLETESRREQEQRLLFKNDGDPEEGAHIAESLQQLERRIKSVRHFLGTMKTTIREIDIVTSFRRERYINEQAREEAEHRLCEAIADLDSHESLKPKAGWWSNLVCQCRTTIGHVRKRAQISLAGGKPSYYGSHHIMPWSRYVSQVSQSLCKFILMLEKGLETMQSRAVNSRKAVDWNKTLQHLRANVSDAKRHYDKANIKWRKAAKTVAKRFGVPKRLVHLADRITADGTRLHREQHAREVNQLNELITNKSKWLNKQANHQRKREEDIRRKQEWEASQDKSIAKFKEKLQELQRSYKSKQDIAVAYSDGIAAELASRRDIEAQYAALGTAADERADARELFGFWDSAFSKRGVTTFRAYVLEQALGEVNQVAAEILASLYQDTRHARDMAAGMLKHLFATTLDGSDENEESSSNSSSPRLIDSTSLGVTSAFAYAKRSGGERKRVDLALFFALVLVGQGRGAHRARYLLIDEVFDSLDPDGQAAVARWCRYLLARVDFVAVITHSELLLKLAAEEEGQGGTGAGFTIWRARSDKKGTVLDMEQS